MVKKKKKSLAKSPSVMKTPDDSKNVSPKMKKVLKSVKKGSPGKK